MKSSCRQFWRRLGERYISWQTCSQSLYMALIVVEIVILQLKQEYSDDAAKMQAALPAILEGEKLSKFVFTPVYNPRSEYMLLRASCSKLTTRSVV